MISPTTDIFKLDPDDTSQALLNRQIFRIFCCSQKMQQIYVQSVLPTTERPFGLSLITLECSGCQRQIQLEAIAGTTRFDLAIDYLEMPMLKRDL